MEKNIPHLPVKLTDHEQSLGSDAEAYNGTQVNEYFSMMLGILTKHKAR